MKTNSLLPTVTPGEILDEEFLKPLAVTKYRIAKDIGISPTSVGQIVTGDRAITPDVALRLGAYFGTTAKFWLNLQIAHDLEKLERDAKARPKIERCKALTAAADSKEADVAA